MQLTVLVEFFISGMLNTIYGHDIDKHSQVVRSKTVALINVHQYMCII